MIPSTSWWSPSHSRIKVPLSAARLWWEVRTYLADKADAKGVDLSELVNEMLKKQIEIIEAAGNKGFTSRIDKKLIF